MDRAKFFAAVRGPLFAGGMSTAQVSGTEAILNEAERRGTPLTHLAYMLATAFHETARSMQPIKEFGGKDYFTRMYDIKGSRPAKARELGNLSPGDGTKFAGRGYVQLTGRSNYSRAGEKIDVDLIAKPDAAMVPSNAAKIMFVGMEEGWFTKKNLADYLKAGKPDYYGARRIINGLDRAADIAAYAKQFEAALRSAGYDGKPYIPARDEKPSTPAPVPDREGSVNHSKLDKPATVERKADWLTVIINALVALLKGGSK